MWPVGVKPVSAVHEGGAGGVGGRRNLPQQRHWTTWHPAAAGDDVDGQEQASKNKSHCWLVFRGCWHRVKMLPRSGVLNLVLISLIHSICRMEPVWREGKAALLWRIVSTSMRPLSCTLTAQFAEPCLGLQINQLLLTAPNKLHTVSTFLSQTISLPSTTSEFTATETLAYHFFNVR